MLYTYTHIEEELSHICVDDFELDESMRSPPTEICPKCGRRVARRIFAGQRPVTNHTPMHHS